MVDSIVYCWSNIDEYLRGIVGADSPAYTDEMDAHMQAASSQPIGVFGNEGVRGNDWRVRELIREHMEAAATGNHSPRRHPIHVPTAPGEPVRG